MIRMHMRFTREELVGSAVSLVVVTALFAFLRFDVLSMIWPTDTEESVDILTIDASHGGQGIGKAMNARGEVVDLIIDDVVEGTGKEVKNGSRVSVHYVGTLIDGTRFDNSYEKGEPYTFTVGTKSVIAGWDQGLMGMREGGERILVVPAHLGYGARTLPNIPAHSTLLFSIELIDVE